MKFETKRLILKSITESDAHDIFDIRSNEIIDFYIKRKKPESLKEALNLFI
jgi:ribosomal-protein-alanine N-acetyltransferase